MSELPDLPTPPRRTRPLPEGGLDAVVAAARARRSRTLAAGTTTVLALVLAAVLVPPTGAVDALHAAFAPGPEPVAAPTDEPATEPPTAAVPTADPTGEPDAEPTATPNRTAPPESSAPASPAPSSAPARTEPPAATPPPTSASPRATPTATAVPAPTSTPSAPTELPAFREDTAEVAAGPSTCTPGPDEASCTYEQATGSSVKRGEQVTAAYGRCQGRGAPPTVLAFSGGQEKDVVVTDAAGAVVFRFSDTVRYVQGGHERRTRPGTCLQWTGRWDLVTTAGEPVPAGTYRVTTTVVVDRVDPDGDGDDVARDVRASTSVTVSVVG